MKKLVSSGVIFLFTISIMAQRALPPSVAKAIPSKYKVTSQLYMKPGLTAVCEISLAIPNKFGCNDGNLGECNIGIKITQNDEAKKEYLTMIDKKMPFQSTLPNASNYKPSADPYNQLVSYSPTKELKLEDGSAAYYIQKTSCIQDQHKEYESVSFKSLQGNFMKSIEIRINGGISADDAIAAAKELYGNLNQINYLAP